MNRKLVPHHSHWGAFNAIIEDGNVVGAVPFDFDPDPSPLIEAIPDAVHSPLRIIHPMVRARWLEDARASGEGRGREPFVPVDWEQALELVAGELARVRREQWPFGDHGRLAGVVIGRSFSQGARAIAAVSRRLGRLCRPDQQLQLRDRTDLSAAYPRQRTGGHRAR
jgi:biotin/methionine sulfoxide reductase